MSKKVLIGIFIVIGVCWIAGVSYWYMGGTGSLNIENIKWKENFSSEDIETQDFFRGVLLVFIPLIIIALALLFYSVGLFFGNKSKEIYYKVEEENEDLKSKLAQQVDKIETMKILYTGGKIEKKREYVFLEKVEEQKTIKSLPREEEKANIKSDDLKIIEGIGERIEYFLNESGIYTWEQLSQSTEEEIKNILLIYGGISYKIHNPSTWPEQANLAYLGRWEELAELKEKIRGIIF